MTLLETLDELVSAWRAGDALRASAFFSIDATYHESGRTPIVGRPAIAEHFTRFFRDGPPWKFKMMECILDGERAAITYEFELLTAQGWHVRAGCAVIHREAGAIALWREYHG